MRIRYLLLTALAISALPGAAYTGEIHYGSLKEQRAHTLLIEYKGPAGAAYFTCSVSGTCKDRGTTTPEIFPSVLGSRSYARSADGRLAVKPFVFGTYAYYFLYDISGAPKKLARIPYTTPGATVYIAKNNNAVIFRDGLTFTRYDIATNKLRSMTLDQNLAFLSISPTAAYVTGYNYNALRHELWRFADGTKLESPDSMQSYLEFSEDERSLAFLEDVDGFRTLFAMSADELGKHDPSSLVQLTRPDTETEDYLYIGDTLYYLANVEGPLDWDLFAYNGKKSALVEEDVSYGDFLKRVRTEDGSYLAYQKTSGKNTDIVLVSPNPGKKKALTPVAVSPASTGVTRAVKTYGNRTGVLLSPTHEARKPALFIWMHGGPQRQVAVNYHPYLSYAVYDELLERLAEGGHYVYKIDYTGSSGYGAEFRKALYMRIGDIEMSDIARAIKDLEKDLDVDRVYLIGNSYGGYMALRGIVDMPELLDGAVSINGVSDWYGLIQQIPSSPFATLFNGVPDTHNLEAYFQASVFLGMEDLTSKDKVFVVWSENDSTVPAWQSTKYVEYAEAKGVNIEVFSFPDEDHILRKRSNLDALCETVTDFLNVGGVACEL